MLSILDRLPKWLWPQPGAAASAAFPIVWTPDNCEVLWGIMQDLLEEGRSRRSMEPTLTAAAIGFSAAATFGVYSVKPQFPAAAILIALSILLGLAVVHKIRAEHCRYIDCRRELHAMAHGLAVFLNVSIHELPYVYRMPVPGKGHRGSLLIVWICILLQVLVAIAYVTMDSPSDIVIRPQLFGDTNSF
jgi:hypothetical protein